MPGQEQTETDHSAAEDADVGDGDSLKDVAQPDVNGQSMVGTGMPDFGAGFGFDPAVAGSFTNMGFGAGGDFNQMQMMMAMQNGMAPNAFGNFPMMGTLHPQVNKS